MFPSSGISFCTTYSDDVERLVNGLLYHNFWRMLLNTIWFGISNVYCSLTKAYQIYIYMTFLTGNGLVNRLLALGNWVVNHPLHILKMLDNVKWKLSHNNTMITNMSHHHNYTLLFKEPIINKCTLGSSQYVSMIS
jgi:hypothetical protein